MKMGVIPDVADASHCPELNATLVHFCGSVVL